jgi:hypothetical protein
LLIWILLDKRLIYLNIPFSQESLAEELDFGRGNFDACDLG